MSRWAVWLFLVGCACSFTTIAEAQRTQPAGRLGVVLRCEQDASGKVQAVVVEVARGSMAETAGVQAGDILLSVSGVNIDGPTAIRQIQRLLVDGQPLSVVVSRNGLEKLETVRTLADVEDLVTREKQTLAQVLEAIRDGIGLLADFTPLKEHPATLVWKYGSNAVDLVHSFFTYHEVWYGITQLERSNDQYLYRVHQLSDELKVLMARAKVLRERIATAE